MPSIKNTYTSPSISDFVEVHRPIFQLGNSADNWIIKHKDSDNDIKEVRIKIS